MKLLTSLLLVFILTATSCKKNNNGSTNLSDLPPATQTGANTFGCLVNGKVFLPHKPLSDYTTDDYTCTYQYLYNDPHKAYGFVISATNKINSCNQNGVVIGLDSIVLQQGTTYNLTSVINSQGLAVGGRKSGAYIAIPLCQDFYNYNTTNTVTGQITISFLNEVTQIVSGTFWFNAIYVPNSYWVGSTIAQSDTIHITQGRFDTHFTR